jgi:aminomethyltransferase
LADPADPGASAADGLRRTPLHARHVALGARMVAFAGWEMPLHYPRGILSEHRAVRSAAGLFDLCHMGVLAVRGAGAGPAVDWLCANDPRALAAGAALYTPLCTREGGTVDDAILYCLQPGREYLFVVNAANVEADRAWMEGELAAVGCAAEVADESGRTGLVAVQGPRAEAVLARASGREWGDLGPFRFARGRVGGVECLVARTGYTGEDGFELACPRSEVGRLWDALLAAGEGLGLLPCGLGARDTLRLEAALPLYGHELGRDISPLEARLGRFVKLEGRAFCGSEALRRQAAAGPPRELVGLLPEPPAIARAGAAVTDAGGAPLGQVTSGTFAPTLGRAVALALCRAGAARPGERVGVQVRDRLVAAEVCSLPFYRRPGPRRARRPG